VRISCRFDYQPDVCKDYKETGYCGFGDSCKFMHDRGDYKTGWQLEQEWDDKQRALAKERENREFMEQHEVVEEQDSDDDLPFACLICRKDFKSPIVTR
jgi:RING finger protein 113A